MKWRWFVLGLTACSSLSHTVDKTLLKELSIENKLVLFDAENEVNIALDERERLRRELQNVQQDIKDAHLLIKEAESDEERADEKNDNERAKLSRMAADVAEYKIEYLEAKRDLMREQIDAQDDILLVSRAKYELAKATLVTTHKVRGADELNVEDFKQQVDEAVEDARGTREDLAEQEKELDAVKHAWLTKREELQKASGGGLGSPWADDSLGWGLE